MSESNIEEQNVRMPDLSRLIISSSPHVHGNSSIRKTMLMVVIALLPSAAASVYFFGLRALWVMLVTVASCISVEAVANAMMKRKSTIGDCSAALTGLILALNLPPGIPEWCCVAASIFAIGLGKMVYGGLGYNPFNPALVGRLVLLLAVPNIMSTFIAPVKKITVWASGADAVTAATPLAAKWMQGATSMATPYGAADGSSVASQGMTYMDLFWGSIPGSMGETCFIAILIGGIFLICLKIIRWQVPVCYMGTVAVITGIAYYIAPENPYFDPPLMHLMSGGLAFGAFFMATDMVTTPVNRMGSVVFAVGCGIITSIIRMWGSYPEGITYSILLMNALTPLIDRMTAGKPFGMRSAAQEVKRS